MTQDDGDGCGGGGVGGGVAAVVVLLAGVMMVLVPGIVLVVLLFLLLLLWLWLRWKCWCRFGSCQASARHVAVALQSCTCGLHVCMFMSVTVKCSAPLGPLCVGMVESIGWGRRQ